MLSQGPVPLIFEMGAPGRRAFSLPGGDVPEAVLPAGLRRETPPRLPEVSEGELVRHFTTLSNLNFGVDTGFYPLGSCTMKYNPKVFEVVARLPGLSGLHPYLPEELAQGALRIIHELERYLAEIAGLARVTMQPAAGAHGELVGVLLIRAYHESRGNPRQKILIPDSAHGTNPATAAMAGYEVVTLPSDARGGIDVGALEKAMDDTVAGLMLTNPNTLGLFDENIDVITGLVHGKGGLLYYDGANANAVMGYSRPGDMGFDVVHFNLHKTFATPHGGGGPGAGPVAVTAELAPYLPVPLVDFDGESYRLNYDLPRSIGRVRSFYGNFGVLVKAYAYIRSMGAAGLKQAAGDAVLNANYVMRHLQEYFDLPFDRACKHEFVLSGKRQKEKNGVRTLDMAKRLMDYGFHPPTVYFPLIVEEAMMIEPTETESKETLDRFIGACAAVANEARDEPEKVHGAPHTTPFGRMDETRAARQPDLRWR
ncbi:MAG: aminomethyl-transferring glycine dehydrogenase subunit GcvPB [Peptococcaceae bacterium]|jgi:glycine dehydrogenase subunit 2|nr:aminomethyl-transferring glycine dehydrogenase subunit GcvPB [Peptococcaceae bacterium]